MPGESRSRGRRTPSEGRSRDSCEPVLATMPFVTWTLLVALQSAPLFEDSPAFWSAGEDGAPVLGSVRTTCGTPAKDWIVEVNGGGLALGDFDGDGDVDLVVVDGSTLERVEAGQPGFPPRLFLNRGDATFDPAGPEWAMAGGRWGMGAATGDLDGDGWLDLVVTQWGGDRVFLNQHGAGFRELAESGLVGSRWGSSAAVCDWTGDGVPDLVVANYLAFHPDEVPAPGQGDARWKGLAVMYGPEGLPPVHDQIYRGRGDGTFEIVPGHQCGFQPRSAGYALGLMPLDYDLDGDTDLYVANDSTANHLWENRGDGTFVERAFARSVGLDMNGKEQAGMGVASGDLNGDGRPDLLVTNFSGESNALYVSRGRGFQEASSRYGIAGPSVTLLGWGTALADLDLDGDLDAFCLNGHVYPQADQPGTDTHYAQPDQLYRRVAPERFQIEPLDAGPDRVSRAGALADLDGDGDLDLVALELDGPVHVLRNRARERDPDATHWLRVVLRGRAPNTQGLGARVTCAWEGGQRTAEVFTSAGFQAARPAEAHFGLGTARRARVRVRWPSGVESDAGEVEADRVLVVEEPR